MATNETNGISLRRLKTFLTNLKNIFAEKTHSHATSDITGLDTALSSKATSAQGNKADTAVQSVKIGTTEYKSGTTVTLPSYPTSLPASDVPSWAKASSKPSYTWSEIGNKPSTFTPSSHTHNYAGSSSAGGSANSLSYFQNTSSTNVGQAEGGSNAIAYISDYSGTALTSGVKDGALYRQAYSTSWVHQIYGDYRTGQIAVRGKNNGVWQNWRRVLDESNYKTFCTPANIGAAVANHSHSNYLTAINKTMVINALGYTPPTTNTTYNVATQSANGLFSASDKKKLDGITGGSNTVMKLISSTDYSKLSDAQKKNGTVYFVV